jgi:RNA polymerase sigma-70 factor (ECF subfamily)
MDGREVNVGGSTRIDRPERLTDEDLVPAAMGGDGEAIAALWTRHRRWIAAVILAHKPVFEDLDDLLQEVAVTFVAKVNTLREPSYLRAWLRSVAVNAARASARAGRYRPRLNGQDLAATPGGVATDEHIALSDDLARMLGRLDALPSAYREPLLLRSVHGMRSRQIAELLGVPPAAIDTRIARARRMLRESLDGACGDDDDAVTSADSSIAQLGAPRVSQRDRP